MAISSLSTITSSMKAYQSALDNSANNIANANTQGFKSRDVQFSENTQGGVSVQLSQSGQELNGQAQDLKSATSDTDIAKELVYSLEYKAGFQVAAKLVDAYQERMGTLIDLFE